MAISIYLAASPAQISKMEHFPKKLAWMACHFSSSSDGLSNCPQRLPPESLLILDDSCPIQGHDPTLVRKELERLLEKHSCSGLLLDFQRPGGEAMVTALTDLPCPVVVTPQYASITSGPVLLPPVPPYRLPSEHLKPWAGREIWLEFASDSCEIHLTGEGARISEESSAGTGKHLHRALHCRYSITLTQDRAVFHLHRTGQDLRALLQESEALGVTAAVGMLQEFPEFA